MCCLEITCLIGNRKVTSKLEVTWGGMQLEHLLSKIFSRYCPLDFIMHKRAARNNHLRQPSGTDCGTAPQTL